LVVSSLQLLLKRRIRYVHILAVSGLRIMIIVDVRTLRQVADIQDIKQSTARFERSKKSQRYSLLARDHRTNTNKV
jgi:hypothetical protein